MLARSIFELSVEINLMPLINNASQRFSFSRKSKSLDPRGRS